MSPICSRWVTNILAQTSCHKQIRAFVCDVRGCNFEAARQLQRRKLMLTTDSSSFHKIRLRLSTSNVSEAAKPNTIKPKNQNKNSVIFITLFSIFRQVLLSKNIFPRRNQGLSVRILGSRSSDCDCLPYKIRSRPRCIRPSRRTLQVRLC